MRRLVIRPGAIGDCILSLPAIEHLRAEYLEVWIPSHSAPLVRFADAVRPLAATGLDRLGIPDRAPPAETLSRLAEFDQIISWYGAANEDFRSAVAGLPFQFLAALPDERAGVHAADFFLGQVGGRGPAVPRIACASGAGGYAVIHPFAGSARKRWPLERYRELARRLEARLPVRWCAGPEDQLEGAVRFDDLYELACWLAGASLYVGNDSGITHLAAAAGAPVVALFGPTDPAVWAPRGPRVRLLATPRPGESIERITVDPVWEAVTTLLCAACASAPGRA